MAIAIAPPDRRILEGRQERREPLREVVNRDRDGQRRPRAPEPRGCRYRRLLSERGDLQGGSHLVRVLVPGNEPVDGEDQECAEEEGAHGQPRPLPRPARRPERVLRLREDLDERDPEHDAAREAGRHGEEPQVRPLREERDRAPEPGRQPAAIVSPNAIPTLLADVHPSRARAGAPGMFARRGRPMPGREPDPGTSGRSGGRSPGLRRLPSASWACAGSGRGRASSGGWSGASPRRARRRRSTRWPAPGASRGAA